MTTDGFLKLVADIHSVSAEHEPKLREWVRRYPYFTQNRIMWLKASMLATGGKLNDEDLEMTALHSNDLRRLFFYLYPEMELMPEQIVFRRNDRFSGSYFDILNAAKSDGEDPDASLKKIAQRLKESRSMLQKSETKAENQPKVDQLEEQVKLLIQESRYREAIEILQQLNLINPKKSIYFADQIRFLEKIIENLK
ncbi:MAG: hypothetical protein RBT57_03070 [Paludibacter sp.]|jgi:hypothetical protein|nr:hypothetical protein [Paludibacter sp.]